MARAVFLIPMAPAALACRAASSLKLGVNCLPQLPHPRRARSQGSYPTPSIVTRFAGTRRGASLSDVASHPSQIERLFRARIAAGRPSALAKNGEFRRGARRPSDAVAGANLPISEQNRAATAAAPSAARAVHARRRNSLADSSSAAAALPQHRCRGAFAAPSGRRPRTHHALLSPRPNSRSL